jgi:hypothetical protein
MLIALLLAAIPAMVMAADLQIDHVTVGGRDLKALRDSLAAAGIASEYGGPHSNHATQMALTSFADGSYLELIALQDAPDPAAVAHHEWSAEIRGDAGPAAWAVHVPDINAERQRLQAAHVHVSPPEPSGRARPDGTELHWEAAQIGDQPRGTFFPFIIRDLTPRDLRVFPSGKPTAPEFRGASRVVIATKDLRATAALFQSAYGFSAPVMQDDAAFGAHLAIFPGTPLVLAAPLNAQSWIADRIQRFGEGPCAFVLAAQERNANGKPALKTTSKTKWGGAEISWVDTKLLGWHLGIEP